MGVFRQVDGGLSGRVSRADHEHVLASHGGALGDSAAVEHARTDQRLEAGDAEPLIAGSRGEDDGTRGELFPVGEPEPHLIRSDL